MIRFNRITPSQYPQHYCTICVSEIVAHHCWGCLSFFQQSADRNLEL